MHSQHDMHDDVTVGVDYDSNSETGSESGVTDTLQFVETTLSDHVKKTQEKPDADEYILSKATFNDRRQYFLFFIFYSVRLLSVLCGHSFFSSPPQRPMTSDFEGFSITDFIHYIYFPILILEKEPIFSLLNVQC